MSVPTRPKYPAGTLLFKNSIEYMNSHREFRDDLYEQFARVGRALANPHRLELIDLLTQGERTVEDLARESAMSVAHTSRHLVAWKEFLAPLAGKTAQHCAVGPDGIFVDPD